MLEIFRSIYLQIIILICFRIERIIRVQSVPINISVTGGIIGLTESAESLQIEEI